jgi:hypothetical protein
MKITRKQLSQAADEQIISREQADALYRFLQAQPDEVPRFTFSHLLYYLGGLIAIAAMSVFMTLGWEAFGGAGIFLISVVYAAIALIITHRLAARKLVIPAGICAAFVVCMTPLAIYGLQHWIGVWPDDSVYQDYHHVVKWHWLYMELATLAVGSVMLWKYRYPFLVMPVAVTLWYMTMDVAVLVSGEDITLPTRGLISLYGGLLMIGLALWVDIRSRHHADYAYWLYLFGVVAFWLGLSIQESDSELSKFLYFCINLAMVGVGAVLLRRVFVLFGALGICGYLGYLAFHVFQDSWLFPIALSAIGLGIIYVGIQWQKHEQAITHKLRALLPVVIREWLSSRP